MDKRGRTELLYHFICLFKLITLDVFFVLCRDGVPPEYLHDHSEHGGWTHSHIADRLANEPASMVHRAFDQAASDL